MSKSILIADSATIGLKPAPISPDSIDDGMPETRSQELARSRDRTSHAMVWDCTAGEFEWHYNKDETLVVVTGEAFLATKKGAEERRIGQAT